MAIFNEKYEKMERSELEKLQSERLVSQVKRMYENVPLFKKRMDEANLQPKDIKGIIDISKLPFSNKSDLRDEYPYGLFAVPMKDVVRLHASSGTTGKQIVVGYTEGDLKMWSECVERALNAAGVNKDDFVQVSYGYGLFTGGLGLHDGATKLGATVIPTSTGNTQRQIQTMIDFKSTCFCSTPSYLMQISEIINRDYDKNKLSLKYAILGGEPWTNEMRDIIEKSLNIKAYDIYGLSEVMGPGVSYECEYQDGMHINEDMFIPEIINPDTGEVLEDGSLGELVFTTITKEAFPLIRYRTHDLCRLNKEKCKCGRTFIRMEKPQGRSDDMLIIRGVNVFPSQIEEVLLKERVGITPNYQIIVDRINNNDTFTIKVEMGDDLFSDDIRTIEKATKSLESSIRSTLGIKPNVVLVSPGSIERSEGKAKRVIDNRKLI